MKKEHDVSYAKIEPKLIQLLKQEGYLRQLKDGRYYGISVIANKSIRKMLFGNKKQK